MKRTQSSRNIPFHLLRLAECSTVLQLIAVNWEELGRACDVWVEKGHILQPESPRPPPLISILWNLPLIFFNLLIQFAYSSSNFIHFPLPGFIWIIQICSIFVNCEMILYLWVLLNACQSSEGEASNLASERQAGDPVFGPFEANSILQPGW